MRRTALTLAFAIPLLCLAGSASAAVTVAVDPSADVHPISPLIYGLNFPSDAHIAAGMITVGRWGGNTTTRYNYEIDTANTGADYYFENVPGCWNAAGGWCANQPADPKASSGANAFLAGLKSKGVVTLFTIPTMGYVAKPPPKYNHPFDCGCPKSVTPNQNSFDPYDTNCGDGLAPGGGSKVACAQPSATSVPTTPDWAKAWVAYIVSKFGPANGKRIYALDNEPNLWSSTHRDIRTQKLGYDELWQRMRDYAVAILEADPTAEIAGPAEWGWPNYFCSDKDDISKGCSASSPDRAAHGGTELVAWLLDQAKAYEAQNGKRILHYLDLHYYPQGGDPPAITRSLWDGSYTDPSWINDTIRLVPRMRDWTSQHYPGTKLAISEYDFYHHNEPVGAVTYAEVLGIFAREGVHVATAWSPPDTSETAFAAYRLYRNFDGNGSHFESNSVRAKASAGGGVEAYAAASATRLTVVLVNEKGSPNDVTVTLGNFEPSGAAMVYANDGKADITKHPDATVSGGQVTLTLGAQSITMLVVDGTNPNMLPDPSSSASSSSSSAATGSGGGGATSGSGGAGTGGSSAGNGGAGGSSGGTGGASSSSTGSGDTGGTGGNGGDSGAKGSCGCRFVGISDVGGGAALAGLALAAAFVRRRRR